MTMTGLALLAGCGSNGDQQDNRANAIEANSSVVEVDTLPPDESSETSTNDLVSGDVTPEGDGNLTPPANEQ
ncbi:MAG: hypothetical protein ACJ8EY_07860 [Sphingomicrobium sp.]